jgi:phenylalanyl-tRNA synthetase beta chain
VQILRGASAWWHPGRHGMICLGPKKVLGIFGELHPKVVHAMDLKGPVMAFTLWPEEIPEPRTKSATRPALDLQDLQAVERDFAFVVDAGVEALILVNAAAGTDKTLIEAVSVFDVFSGDKAEAQMGTGKKSIAISVRLQPAERTLTDKEIEDVSARIVDKVAKATGGVLRG